MNFIKANINSTYFFMILVIMLNAAVVRAGQTQVDSLQAIIEPELKTQKILEILKLAAQHSYRDIDKALAYTEIALNRARNNSDLEGQFQTYRERGFILEENNRVLMALKEFENAEIVAQSLKNDSHILSIYTDLAIVNKKLGNYKTTTDYHTKALFKAQEIGALEMIEDSYHGLGSIYDVVGDYEKAIEYYFKSLKIAEQRNTASGVVITLQNISMIYLKTNDHQPSLSNIEKAYKISKTSSDTILMAGVLIDYGKVLSKMENYDLALVKLNTALKLSQTLENPVIMVKALIEISDTYTQKGNLEVANDFFLKCFEYKDYISTKDQALLYSKLGTLNKRRGDLNLAKDFFMKSLASDSKLENSYLSQQNNYSLYEINREEGNIELALSYLENYDKLQKEILNSEKAQRVAEKRFQFEMDKSQKTIQALATSRNRTILIGISATLLLIITFLFFMNNLRKVNNSQLKNKHEEIQYQNKKLTESNEVLRQFAYAAAHDLKEPLRNIGSFISLIRKRYGQEMPDEANTYMDYVVKGVKRMNDLLLDLLEFSAITTEKATSDLVNLRAVLDEVVYSLNDKIISSNTIVDYPDHFPKVKMKRLHLIQLFQNLISNSIKFNSSNPIININAVLEQDKDTLLISVKDNGIGMEKEFEQKIFLLFHQLDKKKGYEGTGIGLTICKNIVEKYNGQIWFESDLGKGTKFFIRLPMDPDNPSQELRDLRDQMKIKEAII